MGLPRAWLQVAGVLIEGMSLIISSFCAGRLLNLELKSCSKLSAYDRVWEPMIVTARQKYSPGQNMEASLRPCQEDHLGRLLSNLPDDGSVVAELEELRSDLVKVGRCKSEWSLIVQLAAT